jgi:hypothetical protein
VSPWVRKINAFGQRSLGDTPLDFSPDSMSIKNIFKSTTGAELREGPSDNAERFSNFVTKYDPNYIRVIGTAGNEMWADEEWSLTIQGQNGLMQFHGYWGAIKAREGDTWKTRFEVTTPRPAATGCNRHRDARPEWR